MDRSCKHRQKQTTNEINKQNTLQRNVEDDWIQGRENGMRGPYHRFCGGCWGCMIWTDFFVMISRAFRKEERERNEEQSAPMERICGISSTWRKIVWNISFWLIAFCHSATSDRLYWYCAVASDLEKACHLAPNYDHHLCVKTHTLTVRWENNEYLLSMYGSDEF